MIGALLVLLAYLGLGILAWKVSLNPVERLRLEGLCDCDPIIALFDIVGTIVAWPWHLPRMISGRRP